MATSEVWRVRAEDETGPGRRLRFSRLVAGIEDGRWGEADQAKGPQDVSFHFIGEHPQLEEYLPVQRLFKGSTSEEAEMDMTPMIDVTFQLLIFFMIACTYVVQKTLDMPQSQTIDQGAGAVTLEQLAQNNVIVTLAADKSVMVDGVKVAIDNLVEILTAAMDKRKGAELALDVADDVDHETVVAVLDAAGGAQIEKVHFIARDGPQSSASASP